MSKRVLILGAGFGGLELSTMLSEEVADEVEVTLIDRNDAFTFGYSKLDVMFGREQMSDARLPYAEFVKPGVRLLREEIISIDPEGKSVTTDAGVHEADVLVIALGADFDFDATPGLAEYGNEFYTFGGAEELAGIIPGFTSGNAIIGVCGTPFKCPPAPSECALLLHDDLVAKGVRGDCTITFVLPLPSPVPPSPEVSAVIEAELADRGIVFMPNSRIASLDGSRGVAVLDDGGELPYDLFLGVPKHRGPEVVIASGLTEDGYVPVDFKTLETRFPGVYAVGDVATAGVPKAGVFSEGAAMIVARNIIAGLGRGEPAGPYQGKGSCYIEFGKDRVARVDIDFLSGPKRTGTLHAASAELVAEKELFGSSRKLRWFGL
ncbi:MAG: FAD-dependent oxidoreductase [Solirubrobacterales bacterium]